MEGWEKRPRESRGDLSLVPGSVGIAAMKSAEKFKSSKDVLLRTECAVWVIEATGGRCLSSRKVNLPEDVLREKKLNYFINE